ncbi:MAG: hypothetical protein ACE5DW_02785 [Thermodesulfobacteriota bacterium]
MRYILNKIPVRSCITLAFVLLAGITSGCAHHSEEAVFLYPGQHGLQGYSSDGDTVTYEDNAIKISVEQIKNKSSLHSPLAEELLKEGFVLLTMEIKNKSRQRALYDPAITSLRDSKMGYFKPMDFTDLYMMKIKSKGISSSLTGAGEIFYDLAERVAPGEASSKILVFPSLTENVEEAELVMKSIYIGKDILDLTFNFILRPKDKKGPESKPQPPVIGPIFK